ncbi:MAG: hypothetical protein JOZ53_01160 [Planctomycetaceae bacterium]|nr:hypothetical protein [Planctomycetaceae bacterium]
MARERKRLAAGVPKLARGRPGSKAAKRVARRKKRIESKVSELFEHRHLFVRRRLSPSDRATLRRITRGLPQLRTLRELMGEVYRRASVHFGQFWQFGQTRARVDLFGYHSLCCFLCGGARRVNDGGHSSDRFGRGRTTL